MSTSEENWKAFGDSLERMKAREAALRAALLNPEVTELDIGSMTWAQIGLRSCAVDANGRIWDTGSNPIRMIFNPNRPEQT